MKDITEVCDKLAACAELIDEPTEFKVGDIVAWKSYELRNRKLPDVGGVAIVRRFMEPIKAHDNPSSTYWTEELDMVIGVIDPEGDYLEFAACSKRFRLVAERVQH